MRFGSNAVELTILRRAVDTNGFATGAIAPVFKTWCAWSQKPGQLAAVNGQREDPIDLVVRVNDCPQNRTISNSDRARLMETDYEIDTVGLPERVSGSIAITLRRKTNS